MKKKPIAEVAVAWVAAEKERKLRRHERNLAWMMAWKSGITKQLTEDCPWDPRTALVGTTPEQKAALALARKAHEVSIAASRKAGALRAALTRMAKAPSPERNRDVHLAYASLCATEPPLPEPDDGL